MDDEITDVYTARLWEFGREKFGKELKNRVHPRSPVRTPPTNQSVSLLILEILLGTLQMGAHHWSNLLQSFLTICVRCTIPC